MAYRKISIDDKITKQEQAVDTAKAKYDAEVAKLKELQDEADAEKKQKVLDAIENSGKSLDDILSMLEN